MKNRSKIFAMCLLALVFTALLTLSSCIDLNGIAIDLGLIPREDIDYSTEYTVMLAKTPGVEVVGDSVIKVYSGDKAEFKFFISKDYVYVDNSAGVEPYRNGGGLYTITLERVKGPTTLEIKLHPKSDIYLVNLYNNLSGATVEYIEGASMMMGKSDVKIKATAPDGYYFSGWTLGAYESEGGQVVSRSSEYSFIPDKQSTAIYANFSEAGTYVINYHTNGGYIVGSDKDTYTVTGKYKRIFPMPMTIRENAPEVSFKREGYTLVGYSTEPIPDYSGYVSAKNMNGFSNLGGTCEIPESGVLDLYLVWASNSKGEQFKLSPVTYSNIYVQGTRDKITVNGYAVSDYLGNSSTVVIPEEIDGKKIIGIGAAAFESSTIKKVVIPKSVVRIENDAFTSQCTSLEELVFFDSLQYVSNTSFPATLKTVIICGQRGSVYSGSAEGCFSMKYQRIRTLSSQGKKMLIVLSGSSSMYGLNSRMLYEGLDGEYEIVNYGTNANTQATFYLEAMSKYLSKGDIVICAPEWDIGDVNGSNKLHWKLFRGNDQGYDIFREVDMSNYTNFFGAWQEHQLALDSNNMSLAAMTMSIKEYQLNSGLNEYGDILGDRYENIYTSTGARDLERYHIDDARAANFNKAAKYITSRGATMLFSFCTKDAMYVNSNWISKANAFTQQYASKLICPVISNVGTYIMDPSLMYNSEWHCNYAGANKRTLELLFDIKRYLDRGGDSYMGYLDRLAYEATEYSNSFD